MENELVKRLREGVVPFVYRKKSAGEVRLAHGTLNPELFTYEYKGSKRKIPADQIDYWDMDKGGWRSLKINNFITIIDNEGTE